MARTVVEFLMPLELQRIGGPMLEPLMQAAGEAGYRTLRTDAYRGGCDWLVLYGYGAPNQALARAAHRRAGGQAILWDCGYFRRDYRVTVNADHPQALLDLAGARLRRIWDIELREDAGPSGPIILVGMGHKSRRYLGHAGAGWEERKLAELRARFPGREIVFRPKPGRPMQPHLPCASDDRPNIEEVLRGASLVVCRHSNVSVDAVVAGVPFECEDGAARWLMGKPYTRENRREFLERLAWFQWRPDEAGEAWRFVSGLASGGGKPCV